MIDKIIATDAATIQGQQLTMKAADNVHEIAGILNGNSIGSGLPLDGIGSTGVGGSLGHDLLLEVSDFEEQAGVFRSGFGLAIGQLFSENPFIASHCL